MAPTLRLPPKAFGFLESHLWGYLLSRAGLLSPDRAANLMMLLSGLLILPALLLVILGWRAVYRGAGELVTTGVYGVLRHPQYLGIVLVATGLLIQWPTLLTYPILVVMCARLSGEEEARLEAQHGETYLAYRDRVPAFIRVIRPAESRPREDAAGASD